MVRVFLSHASQDEQFVRDLANALEAGGEIQVWLDELEIDYGDNIALKMEEGLDADFVLLILSPDSVASKWVKEEWSAAYWEQVESQQTKLAGVLYRECKIPRLLSNKKRFDLQTNQPEGFRQIKAWLLGQRLPVPAIVHLPQRPPMVIGRESQIEALRQRLKEPGSLAYLSGLGGLGKTTVAKEYAHRYQRDFESVHWLPCEGRTLVQIAGELMWQLGLDLKGDPEVILRDLKGQCARKRCLLIFDNVDDEVPAQLLPAGRSSVLITTRLVNLRFLRGYAPLALPLFTEQECFALFHRVVGEAEVERHRAAAQVLFRRIEYLPIAVNVAAALIREDVHYTIAGMAKDLPANAYALLKRAVDSLSATAQVLLAAMAACAPEGFRLALAAEVAMLEEAASLDALQEIRSRSLVDEMDRTARRYRLHALVRTAAGATDAHKQKHAESVALQFDTWESDWRRCEEDLADWQLAFSWCLQADAWDEVRQTAVRLAATGFSLTWRLGRMAEAFDVCARIIEVAHRSGDQWLLQGYYGNQAVILEAWGRPEEAMALHKKEEFICQGLGNQDGLQRSYGNQALILMHWGRLADAMALHKKKEAICQELGNQDGLGASYGNQASILHAWGRLEEAMALHKKEEAISEELGNQDGLGRSYGNQAVILRAWGRLDEAMALLGKKEVICQKLGNQSGLAYCYWSWGLVARLQGDRLMEKEKLEQALSLFTELKMPRGIDAVQEELNVTNAMADKGAS